VNCSIASCFFKIFKTHGNHKPYLRYRWCSTNLILIGIALAMNSMTMQFVGSRYSESPQLKGSV
jgi:hypothetical protein